MVLVSAITLFASTIAVYLFTTKYMSTHHRGDKKTGGCCFFTATNINVAIGHSMLFIAFIEGVITDQIVAYSNKVYQLSEADSVTAINIFLFSMALTRVSVDLSKLHEKKYSHSVWH